MILAACKDGDGSADPAHNPHSQIGVGFGGLSSLIALPSLDNRLVQSIYDPPNLIFVGRFQYIRFTGGATNGNGITWLCLSTDNYAASDRYEFTCVCCYD